MDNEELEKAINELNEVIDLLGDIDFYNYTYLQIRTQNQKKLNISYDKLYKLKKHLEFIRKRRGV